MNDVYLTVDQADQLLPTVIPLLKEARSVKNQIERIAAAYNYDAALLKACEEENINRLAGQLRELIDELEILGCYIKDLDIGLIDFLSTFEGRDVFLCWKLGEHHISHWHEISEGFSTREPIVDLEQVNQQEAIIEMEMVSRELKARECEQHDSRNSNARDSKY